MGLAGVTGRTLPSSTLERQGSVTELEAVKQRLLNVIEANYASSVRLYCSCAT